MKPFRTWFELPLGEICDQMIRFHKWDARFVATLKGATNCCAPSLMGCASIMVGKKPWYIPLVDLRAWFILKVTTFIKKNKAICFTFLVNRWF